MDDVRATTLDISMQIRNCCVVSVLVSLIDDLVSTLHRVQLSDAQILLDPLESLQVLLQTFNQVVSERFLACVPIR